MDQETGQILDMHNMTLSKILNSLLLAMKIDEAQRVQIDSLSERVVALEALVGELSTELARTARNATAAYQLADHADMYNRPLG